MEENKFENKGTMSRRGFIGFAGIAGAAVAGAGMLAGCASDGTSSASNKAAEGAEPIAAVDAPGAWDKEADVVVCGTGGGLVAAVRSAELGNSVVVLEKANTWGGSSKETDIYSIMGSETQKNLYGQYAEMLSAAGQEEAAKTLAGMAQVPAEMMQKQFLSQYITQPGNGHEMGKLPDGTEGAQIVGADVPLIEAVIGGVCGALDWMGEYVGVEWDVVHEFAQSGMVAGVCPKGSEQGGFVSRANYSAFEMLYEKALDLGVEFLMLTPMETLVKDGNKVIGVKGKGQDGEIFVKANKGVILATGGMSQNKEMLERYVPSVGYRALTATASMMDTGEGILAAWGAGADMQGYDASFCFDGGIDCGTWNHYLYKGDVQVARQPWLGINIQGERYPYYPVDTLGFTRQCGILMHQPRNRGYVVFDANYEETIWNWEKTGEHQLICRRPMWPEGTGDKQWDTGGNYERLPEGVCEHDWRIGFQQGVDEGYIYKCDTLEELAEKIDMPADKLKAAVDNWNALCEAGVDEQWHFAPEWLVPIKDAPYYSMAVGSTVLATNCGVAVTPDCQAIGTDGNVIEGLYAAGSCVGGVGGDSTYGDCRNPGGGVGLTCGTAFMAANAIG